MLLIVLQTETIVINQNLFLVKEHAGIFKAANNYDIYNPDTNEIVMMCRENKLNIFNKILRFTKYKQISPFNIQILDANDNQLIRVERGFSLIRSKVRVYDQNDEIIGTFKQKLISIGGSFRVLDKNDVEQCMLKGKWTSWDFHFMAQDVELAHVSKEWAGMAKELFTSADNYVLSINEIVPADSDMRKLIIAAVMCIDMVLKE